jgi:hypothetical protein
MKYIQLTDTAPLPNVAALRPFKAVVIVEATVDAARQAAVSEWLVGSGCLYMMTWGQGCSSWNDAVNLANLEAFNFADIPDTQLVITTCHENQPLHEVFWFSKYTAMHPCFPLDNILLLHLSPMAREAALSADYARA